MSCPKLSVKRWMTSPKELYKIPPPPAGREFPLDAPSKFSLVKVVGGMVHEEGPRLRMEVVNDSEEVEM